MHWRNLSYCLSPALLSFQQISGWLKSPEDHGLCMWGFLQFEENLTYFFLIKWSKEISTTMTPMLVCLLILIRMVLTESWAIQRQTSVHSRWSVTKRFTPPSCLASPSYQKTLYPSITTLQALLTFVSSIVPRKFDLNFSWKVHVCLAGWYIWMFPLCLDFDLKLRFRTWFVKNIFKAKAQLGVHGTKISERPWCEMSKSYHSMQSHAFFYFN